MCVGDGQMEWEERKKKLGDGGGEVGKKGYVRGVGWTRRKEKRTESGEYDVHATG